jgi:hypothetical protein
MAEHEWRRAPERDKRIAHGDDFAGDAWVNRAGEVTYTVPTYDKNTGERRVERTRGPQEDGSYIF